MKFKKYILAGVIVFGYVGVALASPVYQPGQTLDPACLPTDPTCTVATSTGTGSFTSTTGTSTIFYSNALTAVNATSTNLFTSLFSATAGSSTNFYANTLNASSFVAANATTTTLNTGSLTATNATTTSLFTSTFNATAGTSTNFYSNILTVGSLTAANATTTTLSTGALVSTNATSTNLFASVLSATVGTITNLNSINATSTNFNTTNLTATNATTTSLFTSTFNATAGTSTNFAASVLNVSSLSTLSSLYLPGFLRDSYNATGTPGQVLSSTGTSTQWITVSGGGTNQTLSGNLSVAGTSTFATTTAASSSITTLNAGLITASTINAGTGTITNLSSTNSTSTNATSTNLFASVLSAVTGTFTNLFTTNFTSTNSTSTNATSTNLFASVLSAVTGTFTNLFTTNFTSTNSTSTNATTTNSLYVGGNFTSYGGLSVLSTATSTFNGPVVFATTTDNTSFPYRNISAWGDSLTGGECPACGMYSYTAFLQAQTGVSVFNAGVGGDTSYQVLTRMQNSDKDRLKMPTIIWVGRNDVSQSFSQATTLANIASMVALLKTNQYVIFGVTNTRTELKNSANWTTVTNLNAALAAAYPGHYWDVRSYIVASLGTGTSDYTNDIPPISLWQNDGGFWTHPNASGNQVIAQGIATNVFPVLFNYPQEGKVVTDRRLGNIFAAPPTLGSVLPNDAYFKTINIGATASSTAGGVQFSNNFSLITINGYGRVASTTDAGTSPYGTTDYEPSRSELSGPTATDWTSTGWTGSASTGFTHTIGNASPLSESLNTGFSLNQDTYLVSFTISSLTSGYFTATLGGTPIGILNQNSPIIDPGSALGIYFQSNGTYTVAVWTGSSAGLIITPTTDFNGTISNVSIRENILNASTGLLGSSMPVFSIKDSTGAITSEMRFGSSTQNSTFIGLGAGQNQSEGFGYNVGFGNQALSYNKTGYQNVAVGYKSLNGLISGVGNVAVGSYAGFGNLAGPGFAGSNASGNIGIGFRAWGSGVGSRNIGIGDSTLYVLTGGQNLSSANIAIGSYADRNITTGNGNIALGLNALTNGQAGNNDVVIGTAALQNSNPSIGSDVVIGATSGLNISTGQNIIVGANSAQNLTSGQKNTLLGYGIEFPSNTLSNQLDIGNIIYGTNLDGTGTSTSSGGIGIGTTSPGSRLFVQGSSASTNLLVLASSTTSQLVKVANDGSLQLNKYGAGTLQTDALGNVTVSSDNRLKNIQGNFTKGLAAIEGLQPINYTWKAGTGLDTNTTYTGFSAQNVQAYIPEAVGVDSSGYLTLQDRPLIAALVNAVQQLVTMMQNIVTNSVIALTGTFTQGLTVGSSTAQAGIVMYDRANGQPYCLSISNGLTQTTPGLCTPVTTVSNPIATSTPDPVASSTPIITINPVVTTPVTSTTTDPVSSTTPPVIPPITPPVTPPTASSTTPVSAPVVISTPSVTPVVVSTPATTPVPSSTPDSSQNP